MKKIFQRYIDSYRGLSTAAWLLALVMLINRSGSMVIPFLGMYMSSQLGFSKPQIGIVLGCFGLGSVCGSLIGGWLTDKFGNFKIQAFSLLAAIPMFAIMPIFETFHAFAVMIFLLTVVVDIFRPANSVSVARYARPENITRAYSLNRMALNLGFSIGPAIGGFLAGISYHWIFYGNAITVGAAAVVFIAFFYNRQPRTSLSDIDKQQTQEKPPGMSPYRDNKFILFNMLCCLFAMAFFQLITTLPLYYQDVHQLPERSIGLLLGFSGFVIVVFEMILIHSVEHRFSARKIMVIGTMLTALSFLMLNAHLGLLWLYLAMFVLSFGEMLVLPFTATVTAQRAPVHLQGAYMGFNSMAFAAANIFSPYLGTYTADRFGYDILWWITTAVLMISSIGFGLLLKRMR